MAITDSTPNSPSEFYTVPWTGGAPANYDIRGARPGTGDNAPGYHCRQIVVGNPTGALVVTRKDGVAVTFPQSILLACPILVIEAIGLVAAGSSAADVAVFW